MGEMSDRDILRHCEMLGQLAFEVFSFSQLAHYMAELEERGDGVAFGMIAVHTQFSMSYSSYQALRLYYVENAVLRNDVIEGFLRSYADFSRAFSGNWVATAGVDAVHERFEVLEASYHGLQTLLRATRDRCHAS
ncbi:MAG: hypothetical protein IKV48_06585 [Eggerthellaceae bacterium]|nr:hypothetical protein [Eggerthellaceae bacterium]